MYLTGFSHNFSGFHPHSKYFYLLDDKDRSGVYPSCRRFAGGGSFPWNGNIYFYATPRVPTRGLIVPSSCLSGQVTFF